MNHRWRVLFAATLLASLAGCFVSGGNTGGNGGNTGGSGGNTGGSGGGNTGSSGTGTSTGAGPDCNEMLFVGGVGDFACAAGGTAFFCWGYGITIGLQGDTPCANPDFGYCVTEPTAVDLGSPVVSATGGNGLGCAVLADGTVWCWGENEGGYLGLGNKSGTACGGLNGTNQHKCSPSPVQVASLGNDNKSISTGGYCVLKNDGLVWCLGPRPGDGELVPLPVPALTDVESIANGCAIKHDGTLWCKAVNNWATPVAADVKSAASGQATCFVKNDGTVWCVGANDVGQLGTGSTTPASTTTPIQVKALGSDGAEILGNGGSFCALKTDGSVWCWGWDHYGELGDGKETGGTAFPSPTQVEALGNDVLHLAKGVSLTPCARKKDGSVWCWGSNVWAGAGTGSVLAGAVTPSQVHGAICQ